MKPTVKTALGGMCVALSAAIMLTSAIPGMMYAIPGAAALLVLFMMAECNKKWALGVYFCTSVITAIIVPEKEAVAIYIALLGYYPVLKTVFDKIKPKILKIAVKVIFFFAIVTAAYWILMKFFGISAELMEDAEKYLIPVLYVLGLAAFLLYDRALGLLEFAYYRKWQKKVRKLFKR